MNLQKICYTIHWWTSLFFLPFLCAFAITGICYICGLKETAKIETYYLNDVPANDFSLARKNLSEQGIILPEGEIAITRKGNFLGDTFNRHAKFSAQKKSNKMCVEIITPGIFDKLLLIHKGKAGTYFSVLAIGAGIAMALLYLSGVIFVLKNPARRTKSLAIIALGFIALAFGFFL